MTDNKLIISISDKIETQLNVKLLPLEDSFAALGKTFRELDSDIAQLASTVEELTADTTRLKDQCAKIKTSADSLKTKSEVFPSHTASWKNNAVKLETDATALGIHLTTAGLKSHKPQTQKATVPPSSKRHKSKAKQQDTCSFETEMNHAMENLTCLPAFLKERLSQTVQKQGKPVLYETQASELKFRLKQLEHKLTLRPSP